MRIFMKNDTQNIGKLDPCQRRFFLIHLKGRTFVGSENCHFCVFSPVHTPYTDTNFGKVPFMSRLTRYLQVHRRRLLTFEERDV